MNGVGIVLYYPDYSVLDQSLSAFDRQNTEALLIVNACDDTDKLENIIIKYGCDVIRNEENVGVAKAYNQIMNYFSQKGMQWVLLLDQDSLCDKGYFDRMEKYFDLEKAAVLCPYIKYHGDDISTAPQNEYDEIEWCISSGSMINVDCWTKTEGFDEELFIDWVDFDYCLTARELGYKIYRINAESLEHSLGNLKICKVAGLPVRVTNHNPDRKYYYIRNAIICKKKHNSISLSTLLRTIAVDYGKVLLYEEDKCTKLKNMTKGCAEGIAYKK